MLGLFANDRPTEVNSTTHLSIVDREGNAVSMTASVEAPFGNSRFVKGFLLNNQLTDFRRDADGLAHANAPAAGKQPRSSMSPVMAFDQSGALRLVTGSPGGNSIVAYVAKSLVASLRWGLSDAEAVAVPNVVARGSKVRVETANEAGKAMASKLRELGYDVQEREGENSGLHQISVTPEGLSGAADPRREGTVIAVPSS
jgi:gamma-glutamyltranspeptidase/glutathione hydrolase